MKREYCWLVCAVLLLPSCSTQRKIESILGGEVIPTVSLPEGRAYIPELKDDSPVMTDTLKVTGLDGQELIIMKAVKDEESGEMIASEQLSAAVVTARFRNVAERNGKVELEFQIRVPAEMRDSRWQLCLHPDMFMMGDSIRLDDIVICGTDFRKQQLRGYQQYERFLSRIITDSLSFIDFRNLEIFIKRNIPEVYAFRRDSSYVSDETFSSAFGVTGRAAAEHYTRRLALQQNERRRLMTDRKRRQYVRFPIRNDGIRLDTVMTDENGDFIYNYCQSVRTRNGLRKIDIMLSGSITEMNGQSFDVCVSDPLTFYVSSVSSFADNRERFLTKIKYRRATANTSASIMFTEGSAEIDMNLPGNEEEMSRVRENLLALMKNEDLEMDSIIIRSFASPEGSFKANSTLCLDRSRSVSRYLESSVRHFKDSLMMNRTAVIHFDGEKDEIEETPVFGDVSFISRSGGENWTDLDYLVDSDSLLTAFDKETYRRIRLKEADMDSMEAVLSTYPFYSRIRREHYPCLRIVRIDFSMHRKDMVKDTVHTTEPDTVYAAGVRALMERDFETAVEILRPYQDFNTAIAYLALDYNNSAMSILDKCGDSAEVNYLRAILFARRGDERNAVQHYIISCGQDPSFVYRGNLDPEISSLIGKYGLNAEN